MSTIDDPFGPSAAVQFMSSPRPLHLPHFPVSWSMDRIETALHDIQAASVTGWQSALADTYRDELGTLIRDLRHVRDLVLTAERSYDHLRYIAYMNGEL